MAFNSAAPGPGDTEWTADDGSAGLRLDKFLAAPGRLGSRGRATTALERGKVYVNGAEAGLADAARRLAAGDVVRLWMDRPGSARRRPRTGPSGALDIVYEDDDLLVVNKPAGILSVPLERKACRSASSRRRTAITKTPSPRTCWIGISRRLHRTKAR
jgi:23S rRNA-/tRNA-specific pseudouridylate synthase